MGSLEYVKGGRHMARRRESAAEQTAVDLVDLIRYIVRTELDKRDNTVLGRVVQRNSDTSYDIYVEPDMDTVIHNISTVDGMEKLKPGDYVYVFKVNNQFHQAFIIKKL